MTTTFTSSVLAPHDRGVEFGRRFAAEVADTVARYRRLFETRALGPFDVDAWSARAWSTIQRRTPHFAEEIAGIAAGAGLTPAQVASVNARTELLVAANPTGQSECSTVVSVPADRSPVAAQTWDWYDAMSTTWLTWTVPHPDGRVLHTVTEFGMLAKIGVNDRGVGVLLNMLHHGNDTDAALAAERDDEIGYPVHLLARAILDDAASAEEAVEIASAPPTSASTSLTVVDDRGAAASVELFPGGPGVVRPTRTDRGELLVRTNHFVSDAGRDGCLASTISTSTELRRAHLLDAFAADEPGSLEEVYAAMDHHDAEGGVCRHPLTDTDPVLWHRTLATVGVDPVARALDVHENGPCGHRLLPVEEPALT